MTRAFIIIAWPSTIILSALAGYELAESQYTRIIGTVNDLAEVRDRAHETHCNGRILTILDRIDLKCLGEWSAADGEVTLYPDWIKNGRVEE